MGKRWAVAAVALALAMAAHAARIGPQATAEDVLAALVHQSSVIFAGEVYAIRVPEDAKPATIVRGGMPSSRADAVEVEFRVDVGIRGASIGSNYVLRMPISEWQQAPPFLLHQKSIVFLRTPDASGLSGPVEGESDVPGLDLGVMPVDDSNLVDLSRLQRMVTKKVIASADMLPPPNPPVTDVTSAQGEETLLSGSRQGKMPELRNSTVPFLALVRDVSVLGATEGKGNVKK